MTPEVQSILSDLRRRFEAIYGERLVRMILFGSHARGDAEPGSDIDILVVLKGTVDPSAEISRTGETVSSLSLEHGLVVGCVFMDERRFATRQGPLLRNIRKEGLPL